MVMSLSILDFKNHLDVRVKCFLTFFVEIFFGFKSHPVCDCFKFFPRKISRCSSIFICFPEKLQMKKFKRKLKIHVNYESKIKSGFLLFILQRWWNDQKSRGPLLLNILSVSALFSISGNALERVQRVHEPADLWDITFCTR